MIVDPENSIDMAYGFTNTCLGNPLASIWANIYSVSGDNPLTISYSQPGWTSSAPQFIFSGYSFQIRDAPADQSFLQLGPGINQSTFNLAFFGASFTDNSGVQDGQEPVFYEFEGCTQSPPSPSAQVVNMTGSGALIISFGAELSSQVSINVPATITASLQASFGPGSSSVTVHQINGTLNEVILAWVQNSPTPLQGLAGLTLTFSNWLASAPSEVTSWPLVYIGVGVLPPDVYNLPPLAVLPQSFAFTALSSGVTTGGQAAPSSLLVACSITTPLPSDLSTAVTDAGQLFSVAQLVGGSSAPVPWTGIPQGTFYLASLPLATALVNAFCQSGSSASLEMGARIVSASGDNWGLESSTMIPNPIEAVQLSSADTWGCFCNYSDNYSQTCDGDLSNATINDEISFQMVIGAAQGSAEPELLIQLSHSFIGTTSNSWSDTFLDMSQPSTSNYLAYYTLTTAAPSNQPPPANPTIYPSTPTLQFSGFFPALTGYSNAVSQANTIFENIGGQFSSAFSNMGLAALGIITAGDLSCTVSSLMIDSSYALNISLQTQAVDSR